MISFVHVHHTFPNGSKVLEDVTFHIQPGEFVFVLGESGAGKTSLMRLLTRDLIATQGSVEYFGQNLSTLKGKYLPRHRQQLTVVFQDYKLISDKTVTENIALGLEIQGKSAQEKAVRVRDLLELVGLVGKEHLFPKQLSGGEAQRVSIARALAVGPKVLFADEPTGNLDEENAELILKLLHKINSMGTTILFATHNLSLLKLVKEREIYLQKGKVIKDHNPKQIHKEKALAKKNEPEEDVIEIQQGRRKKGQH